MKVTLRGGLRLRPFDESEDDRRANRVFARWWYPTVLIAAAIFILLMLVMANSHDRAAIYPAGVTVALLAILAAAEWRAELRARAMNLICATGVGIFVLGLLASLFWR